MKTRALVVLCLALIGCPQVAPPQMACTTDATCGAGERCVAGNCEPNPMSTRCSKDDDCAAALTEAQVTPPGCAEARCSVSSGLCVLSAKDQDGDGEMAARCTGRVSITTGNDCNDSPDAGGARISSSATEVCESGMVDENCNGTANEGCGCTNPGMSMACCSGRGTQTCELDGGATVISACTATVSAELCNAVDDDCDGMVDESAALSADGGSLALDGGVIRADGTCTLGIGACRADGAARCTNGSVTCDAAPAAPTAEVCNLLDDDCDGQVDESGPTLCAVSGQTCTSGACACAAGQTVCGTTCVTLGGSCSAGVGECLRSGTFACSAGTRTCSAVAGNPGVEVCNNVDDDCDGLIDENTKVTCYPDADNDRYATSTATSSLCPDPNRPAAGNCPVGYVAPAQSLGTDCNPNDPSTYRTENTSPDADGDGRCNGAGSPSCVGVSPPGGRRFTASCVSSSDCNDNDPGSYVTVTVRTDGDGDGWCVGNAFNACTSGGAPGGTRVSTSCAGTDCKDNNGSATSQCTIGDGYSTVTKRKVCNIGPPPVETFGVSVDQGCPAGFSSTNLRPVYTSPGACSVVSSSIVTIGCGAVVLGFVDCKIIGDCVAN